MRFPKLHTKIYVGDGYTSICYVHIIAYWIRSSISALRPFMVHEHCLHGSTAHTNLGCTHCLKLDYQTLRSEVYFEEPLPTIGLTQSLQNWTMTWELMI
jgi:hypothetical protein